MSILETAISDNNKKAFSGYYEALYKTGEMSLGHSCDRLLRTITQVEEYLKEGRINADQAHKIIWRTKLICEVMTDAKKMHEKLYPLGKIKIAFQKFLGLFGVQTGLEKAKALQEKCDDLLPQPNASADDLKKRAVFEAEKIMAYHCHNLSKLEVSYSAGNTPATMKQVFVKPGGQMCAFSGDALNNPDRVFYISSKDGDVLTYDRATKDRLLGNGLNFTFYKGSYLSENLPKPLDCAIGTTLPAFDNMHKSRTDTAKNEAIQSKTKEQEILERLQGKNISNIKESGYSFLLQVGDNEELFIAEELYPLGDLATVLEKTPDKLGFKQKLLIMSNLITTVYEIHSDGGMHRDIKPMNILIKESKDDKGEAVFVPILADFDTFAETTDIKKKKEIGGTPTFSAPEYATAVTALYSANPFQRANAENAMANVTIPAIDIWSLGLTFLYMWVGNDNAGGILCFFLQRIKNKSLTQQMIDDLFVGLKDAEKEKYSQEVAGKTRAMDTHQRAIQNYRLQIKNCKNDKEREKLKGKYKKLCSNYDSLKKEHDSLVEKSKDQLPQLNAALDMINSMIQIDPNSRVTADQLKTAIEKIISQESESV